MTIRYQRETHLFVGDGQYIPIEDATPAQFQAAQERGYWPVKSSAPPTDPNEATTAAVEALRFARDCLKSAGASRALERVRSAISSADGAVRAAGCRKHRRVPA